MHYFYVMLSKRLVCIFITVLLFVADSGQMLFAHTCLKSKHTTVSLVEIKHCCKEDAVAHERSISKNSCCETSSKYIRQAVAGKTETGGEQKWLPELFATTEIFEIYTPVAFSSSFLFSTPHLPLSKCDICFTQVFRC